MNTIIFIGGKVGKKIAQWIVDSNYSSDIVLAYVESSMCPCKAILEKSVDVRVFSSQEQVIQDVANKNICIDIGLLLYFGPILNKKILSLTKQGFLSMHPALLPYTRGANFNIWPIVDEVPCGVTLFWVNEIQYGIDTGDIAYTEELPCTWEDNGETLRKKAQDTLVQTFIKNYPNIRTSLPPRIPQDMLKGKTRYKKDLEPASCIELDKMYTARSLLNWLRARTHSKYPACYFFDNNEKFEVRITINKA